MILTLKEGASAKIYGFTDNGLQVSRIEVSDADAESLREQLRMKPESGVRSPEQKPTFKVGDKIKLKGTIDKRIFTLAMCGNDIAPYTEDGKCCWVDSDHWTLIESPDEPKEEEPENKLYKKLFNMVYQWGRVGIVTDERCNAFQEAIVEIENEAIRYYRQKNKQPEPKEIEKIEGDWSYEEMADKLNEVIDYINNHK